MYDRYRQVSEFASVEEKTCLTLPLSVVNCAGLYADLVAQMILKEALPSHYRQYYCKGNYYAYSRTPLVSRLIYPVPEKNLKVCFFKMDILPGSHPNRVIRDWGCT